MFVGLLLRMMQRESELSYTGENKKKLYNKKEKGIEIYEIRKVNNILGLIFFNIFLRKFSFLEMATSCHFSDTKIKLQE